jgi:RNA polymerase sigma-70 factor (ECF subfamily)
VTHSSTREKLGDKAAAAEAVRTKRPAAEAQLSPPQIAPGEEAELIREVKARSPDAWKQIFDANYRKLFRYALARTNDRAASEDIASDVFFEALKSIDSFNYRGKPLRAWLYGIARHLVNKHLRSQRRRQTLSGLEDVASRVLWWRPRSHEAKRTSAGATAEPASGINPGDVVERLDVRHALDRLTADQREVTVLYFYAGFSIPEISRLLGKKERAVYSLHGRAIDALRRDLGESELTPG